MSYEVLEEALDAAHGIVFLREIEVEDADKLGKMLASALRQGRGRKCWTVVIHDADGDERIVAVLGNGPRSERFARAIQESFQVLQQIQASERYRDTLEQIGDGLSDNTMSTRRVRELVSRSLAGVELRQ